MFLKEMPKVACDKAVRKPAKSCHTPITLEINRRAFAKHSNLVACQLLPHQHTFKSLAYLSPNYSVVVFFSFLKLCMQS